MKKTFMAVMLLVLAVTLFISCGKPDENPEGSSQLPYGSSESEPAGPSESEPAGPSESEPAGPSESEPAGPSESEPAGPIESDPKQPEESEPKQPEESEPKQPEESEPKQPEKSEPKQPEESEPKQPEESEPKQPEESEPKKPEESEPKQPEESEPEESQDPSRQFAEMNGAELFNYASVVHASLESYTVSTNNEMKFNYAGQKGSYLYTAQVKTEGLTGKTPKFSVSSVRNLDGTESALSAVFMNGYYYKDNGREKVKTSLDASGIPVLLGESVGATAKLSGSVFKALKKTETAGGWLVTGTGLVSGKSDEIINGLLDAFDMGTTASEINLTSFQVETTVNKLGQITQQKTSFLFTMDYSGITLTFEMQSCVAYSAFNSTRVDASINPGEYVEGK